MPAWYRNGPTVARINPTAKSCRLWDTSSEPLNDKEANVSQDFSGKGMPGLVFCSRWG